MTSTIPSDDESRLVLAVHARDTTGVVVAVAGEIDMDNAGQVLVFLGDLLRRERPGLVRLDLREVSFLGSAGMHALLVCRDEADRLGCRLRIQEVRPGVRPVFDICGVAGLFGLPE